MSYLAAGQSVVPCDWIRDFDPGELVLFQFVPFEELLLLVRCEQLVLWHHCVLCNVDNQLGFVKRLNFAVEPHGGEIA
jgi:hypothetical protein